MSRIGKQPVAVPGSVTVDVQSDKLTVKGPKGELSVPILSHVKVKQEDATIVVERINDEKIARSQHGLVRSLVQNMITGVTEGFSKKLEVNGVGFKSKVSGKTLTLALGFSHDVVYPIPDGVEIAVEGNIITVSGIDRQRVG